MFFCPKTVPQPIVRGTGQRTGNTGNTVPQSRDITIMALTILTMIIYSVHKHRNYTSCELFNRLKLSLYLHYHQMCCREGGRGLALHGMRGRCRIDTVALPGV